MRKIIYEDCNNNTTFLKDLFTQIQSFSDTQLDWNISNLDFIPIDKGDYINGVPTPEMEIIYDFQKRMLEADIVIIAHSEFMHLLEDIRTIYEGNFVTMIKNKPIKIKVFDGDIIEVDGELQNKIRF